ncbi:MAG TPA: NAD(P)H-dependent oxidoreductase subunit E [Solirubrobacteraceae bacterium]|nr:NAD(P)H-dependent oxidoreductase subunit E [Solirubrobacteraceae bacterium]
MSGNLTELLARAGGPQAPNALAELKRSRERERALEPDELARIATRTGLPEATIHGIATFYEDLREPRGRRHIRLCTGTACFAAGAPQLLRRIAGELGVEPGCCTEDGETSLAEVYCLGLCHSAPALCDGGVIDAGPGLLERVLAERCADVAAPEPASMLERPVLIAKGDWSGLERALTALGPEQLLAELSAAELRGRGGAGFPAARKWQAARAHDAPVRYIVANGDEGDPGSYIDKYLMEQNPALILEGMALAGYAVGAEQGFILTRSEYPRAKPALEAAIADAQRAGYLGERIAGSDFSFQVEVREGAGSYVAGEETALIACLEGLRATVAARPPYPAERGLYGMPTVVNNVETLANAPFIAREGARSYRALSPGATPGSKLICFNERFARPGLWEVPFGRPLSELCEQLAGGVPGGLKAVQIGGPLGGILPAALLDTPFDFEPLAAVGCMLGHGSIVAFDQATDMRALAAHLLRFGARESCGKCFPCRIGLQRARERFEGCQPPVRGELEDLLAALELGSLCAHGSGIAAPLRSLIEHYPRELGLDER